MLKRELVPIAYHCFPHYRAGVNEALIRSRKYEFVFVGDLPARSGGDIEAWQVPDQTKFLAARNFILCGRAYFQPGVIRVAFRKDLQTIIFLGCAQFITTWLAAAVARLTGKRVLFWSHGWISPDRGIKKASRMAFYRLAHGMLLYGHHAKHIGVQAGLRAENLHVIYNSLDYPAQVAIRQAVREEELIKVRNELFGARAGKPLLICTGRLIPMRRLDLLLEAMRYLKVEGNDVNLLLVGAGPEAAVLETRAKRDQLSVHLYGACYDERILARLFMASDMLVMPGRIGLAAMHSLAYGTPVLIHDDPSDQGPEWESIIPGFNGAYFAHNDSRDLARVIQEWLKGGPGREVLRKQCYEVIERFYNPASQAARIERALDGEPADDSDWEVFCGEHSIPRLGRKS
jgi:glycosyltransferase involved in cell wall biosynthesis